MIYIYCHPQSDCFVLSELFSVARHVGRSKPGSKPIQLYFRLSLKPLGQQAYHVWLREFLKVLRSNSSSRLFTFLYPIVYQSAQFFRRALHYASSGRKFLHQSARYRSDVKFGEFHVFSKTEELWYNETVYGWRHICSTFRGLSTLAKELTVATHVMQSSFNELRTSVSDSVKCKRTKVYTYT